MDAHPDDSDAGSPPRPRDVPDASTSGLTEATVAQPLGGMTLGSTADYTQRQVDREALGAARRSRGAPVLPGYECTDLLGEGTYGEVWRAIEDDTGIELAVKIMRRGSHLRWEGFQSEVRRLGQLHGDPGIVQLKDVVPDAATPFYTMALARGGSLAQRLAAGPLPVSEAIRIFRQVTDALATVHAKGILHCDLKPGNIVFDSRDRALITDFGQAQLVSQISPALGTFFYMAPDQADLSEPVPDPRWDVYALGSLLYTMLVGHPARYTEALNRELATSRQPLPERLKRYRNQVLADPKPKGHRKVRGVDADLAAILETCLEVDPRRRYRDAGAVLAALDRRDGVRRNRPILALGFLTPILLIGAVISMGGAWLRGTLDKAETALASQMLTSNLVSARLAANVFEDKVHDLMTKVEGRARSAELREGVARKDWPAVDASLRAIFEDERRFGIDAWLLTDDRGVIRGLGAAYRPEPDDDHWLRSFAWREWFNGQANHAPLPGPVVVDRPLDATRATQMFISTRTRREVMAFSTPIRSDDGAILGVLMAQVYIDDLNEWLEDVALNSGSAMVIDRQGHSIRVGAQRVARLDPDQALATAADYRALCVEAERTLPDGKPRPARTLERREFRNPDAPGAVYLASFALLPTLDWGGILIEHERAEVLRPIDELRRTSSLVFLFVLLTLVILTAASWAWLVRTLRRESGVVAC